MIKVNLLAEQRYINRGLITEDETPTKRKMVVLVGPPSVGKSTWIKSNFPNAYVINRDDIVEKVASKNGWTYDDMFVTPPADAKPGEADEKYGQVVASPEWMTWAETVFDKVMSANGEVQNHFASKVKGAHPSGQDVVVDMTNMNAGSRKGALAAIEGNEGEYMTVAVDFKFAGAEELIKKMAAKRAEAAQRMGKSKTIPAHAFDRMFKSYEAPSKGEGFDEIISVDNIGNLKNALAKGSMSEEIGKDYQEQFEQDTAELFNKIKQDLSTIEWVDYGGVDSDAYELLGRDDAEELEQAVEFGEISRETVIEAIKYFLDERYASAGVEIDVHGYGESNSIQIYIKKGESGVGFKIEDELTA